MKTYSLYDAETGEIQPGTLNCPLSQLAVNTPSGFGAIEGEYDPRVHKVDLQTGHVVVRDIASLSAISVHEFDSDIHRRINQLELERKLIERSERERGAQGFSAETLAKLSSIDEQVDRQMAALAAKRAANSQRQD